jgi:hypothetical protein
MSGDTVPIALRRGVRGWGRGRGEGGEREGEVASTLCVETVIVSLIALLLLYSRH